MNKMVEIIILQKEKNQNKEKLFKLNMYIKQKKV